VVGWSITRDGAFGALVAEPLLDRPAGAVDVYEIVEDAGGGGGDGCRLRETRASG
jgi:hypothetical protein